jgi:hypothetical protein
MTTAEWGLYPNENAPEIAARLWVTTEAGLKKLEQFISAGAGIPQAVSIITKVLIDQFKIIDKNVEESEAINILKNIVEEFIFARFGLELDPFWSEDL